MTEPFDQKLGDMTAIEAEWAKAPKAKPMRPETMLECIARVPSSRCESSKAEQAAHHLCLMRTRGETLTTADMIALERILLA